MTRRRTTYPAGLFIVLEGLDGAGTTTQAQRLTADLRVKGWPTLFTSEPSIGPMGHIIRLMLTKRLVSEQRSQVQAALSNDSTALLFAADRLDHLQHEVVPKLDSGVTVICDRYYLSSYAYQRDAEGGNFDWLKAINSRCRVPELTLFLRTSPEVCALRRSQDRWHRDLFEEEHILERVAANYEVVIADRRAAGERIETIDGNQPTEAVAAAVMSSLRGAFAERFRDVYPLFEDVL